MRSANHKLTIDDKMGFFVGTIVFVFTLPMSLLFSFLIKQFIAGSITNTAVGTAVGFIFLGVGAVANLVFSLLIGLMISYSICWLARKAHVPALVEAITHATRPIEIGRFTPVGAVLGAIVATALFLISGNAPLDIVTQKVEQLFPAPIVMSLGSASNFDLSHAYAAVTGLLTVGGLFVVTGLGVGSLGAATLERIFHRRAV